ncbi:hypothetical protein [Lysinibacter sp. HNR]|uniref:hypothetical protein n=1 Tax=Lysinibacter sp. HNR TaxID=3031408 RepID=UPI00243503F7|nr:hypothetical protein [Lysinibacter sp. HNR]WGD36539.1 hypothetical protein FrondiHNR_08645 [Lysinibacter sp. HNR]
MTSINITTNLDEINLDTVHEWLSTDTHWAKGRSRETVERAAQSSLNFGVLSGDK